MLQETQSYYDLFAWGLVFAPVVIGYALGWIWMYIYIRGDKGEAANSRRFLFRLIRSSRKSGRALEYK